MAKTHILSEAQKGMLTRGVSWSFTHREKDTIAIDGDIALVFTGEKTMPNLIFNEKSKRTFLSRILKSLK